MAQPTSSLVWFRRDLRLADNPALLAASKSGTQVIPIFIWSPRDEGRWPVGAASRWWLDRSLRELDLSLRRRGSRLVIRKGPTLKALEELIDQTGATDIYWNDLFEPPARHCDRLVEMALRKRGVDAHRANASLLFHPAEIKTGDGKPYRVFSAFWRACMKQPAPDAPLVLPATIKSPGRWPKSLNVADLNLEPEIDWAGGLREQWSPGEAGAARQLRRFLKFSIHKYADGRDIPGERGTSRLSGHLHFGEISPRQIWSALRSLRAKESLRRFRAEIGWREFAHHLLYHFPDTPEQPLQNQFARFPWRNDRASLRAWQRGQTGYPIVDAGMRELWHTGWMHNRVRMIVASFLVKDLLIPWQKGAEWFWDTLVDADLANNTLGWQWTAGCGADAAPYFRVFNPVLQGQKFDPDGEYVRRWLPELVKLPNTWLHHPWDAPIDILNGAGIELGANYPKPIVDHATARIRALAALRESKHI